MTTLDIQEVDKKLHIGSLPYKFPAYVAWFITFFIWAAGVIGFIKAISGELLVLAWFLTLIAGTIVFPHLTIIIIYLVLAIAAITFVSLLVILLINKIAREVLIFILLLVVLSQFALGGIMVYYGISYGVIPIIIGAVLLIIFLMYLNRIKFTGRLIELSAAAILREKSSLGASFISIILEGLTLIASLLASSFLGELAYNYTQDARIGGAVGIIVLFLGFWSVTYLDTVFDAVIVGLTHDWYRSPGVDIASFPRALKRALRVQGGLAVYSFLMSLLRFATEQAKRKKGISARIIASILGITEDLVRFLTFYVVPAMVIRQTNFKNSLKDSIHKLKDLFIETLVAHFGFGWISAIFGFVLVLLYGAVGYLIGAYIFTPIYLVGYNISSTVVGIISAIIYVILGIIPAYVIFESLSVAFNTMLYEFGLDIEFAERGEKLPRNLPPDVEKEFIEILRSKGIQVSLE